MLVAQACAFGGAILNEFARARRDDFEFSYARAPVVLKELASETYLDTCRGLDLGSFLFLVFLVLLLLIPGRLVRNRNDKRSKTRGQPLWLTQCRGQP